MGEEAPEKAAVSAYEERGFSEPKPVLSEEQANQLHRILLAEARQLLDDGATRDALSFAPWLADFHPFESSLHPLLDNKDLRELIADTLGHHVMLRSIEIHYRGNDPILGSLDNGVPWKWDAPGIPGTAENMMSLWLSLAAPLQAPLLQVLSGSHKTPLPRENPDLRSCIVQEEDWTALRTCHAIDMTIPAGNAMALHPWAVYGLDENPEGETLSLVLRFFRGDAPAASVGAQSGLLVGTHDQTGPYEVTPNVPILWREWDQGATIPRTPPKSRLDFRDALGDEKGHLYTRYSAHSMETVESVIRSAREEAVSGLTEEQRACTSIPTTSKVRFDVDALCAWTNEEAPGLLDLMGSAALPHVTAEASWSSLLRLLQPIPHGEEDLCLPIDSPGWALVVAPGEPDRTIESIRLDSTPITAFARDVGLLIGHLGSLAGGMHAPLHWVLPLAETRAIHDTLVEGLAQGWASHELAPEAWAYIGNCSRRTPREILNPKHLGHCSGVVVSFPDYARAHLSSETPSRKFIREPWQTSTTIQDCFREHMETVQSEAAEHGLPVYRLTPIGMERLEEDFPPRPAGEPILSAEDAVKAGLVSWANAQTGEGDMREVLAHVAQQRAWVTSSARIGDDCFSSQVFTRTIRHLSDSHGKAVTTAWRQWVLGLRPAGS